MGYCRLIRLFSLLLFLTAGIASAGSAGEPPGESGWRLEFDALCGQVENSMSMTAEELRASLQRCERLKWDMEKLEPTQRKVYQKRLEMCRKLLSYMLEKSLQGGGE